MVLSLYPIFDFESCGLTKNRFKYLLSISCQPKYLTWKSNMHFDLNSNCNCHIPASWPWSGCLSSLNLRVSFYTVAGSVCWHSYGETCLKQWRCFYSSGEENSQIKAEGLGFHESFRRPCSSSLMLHLCVFILFPYKDSCHNELGLTLMTLF